MIQGFDIKVLAKLQTIYDLITSSPPGSTTWGSITGTLSSQTDLQTALDAKFDLEDINPICKLGENINKGQAVYISSANGTNMIISKASNAAESTSSKTFGLLSASGVTNDQIRVITSGFLAGLDTSTANAAGDPVWLGTSGNLIYGLANKPVAPAHLVFIGIVTRKQSNNGEIFIKVQNGFELQELHNVDAVNPSNNDGIFYNTSTSLWEHKSIATVLGYTPYSAANPSGYITSSALSGYLTSATAASTYYPLTNPSSYISGITSLMVTTALGYTPYSDANPSGYITSSALSGYLTSATAASTYQPIGTYATASNSMSFTNKSGNISQWTNDSGYITSSALSPYLTSATAASTYQTILSAASASANGYLTSTDWSTFNNKQAAITGAASTVTTSNLTANRVVISNASGKIATNSVTDTEVGYLSGVTSAIQTQINSKQDTLTLTTTGTSGAATLVGSTLNIPQYSSSPIYAKSTTTYSSSGTGSQILTSLLIPANTFTAGDILRITVRWKKVGTASATQCNTLINTSASLSGATTIKAHVTAAATLAVATQGHAVIINQTTNTQYGWTATNIAPTDFANSTASFQESITTNWTSNQYIILSANPASTDVVSVIFYMIEKL